jgi:hypothetical protein
MNKKLYGRELARQGETKNRILVTNRPILPDMKMQKLKQPQILHLGQCCIVMV